jgi:hypothetical protein
VRVLQFRQHNFLLNKFKGKRQANLNSKISIRHFSMKMIVKMCKLQNDVWLQIIPQVKNFNDRTVCICTALIHRPKSQNGGAETSYSNRFLIPGQESLVNDRVARCCSVDKIHELSRAKGNGAILSIEFRAYRLWEAWDMTWMYFGWIWGATTQI